MKPFHILLTGFLWWACFKCFAQNEIDSLQGLLQKTTGRNRADICNQLSSLYLKMSLDTAAQYAEKAFLESEKAGYKSGIALSHLNKGYVFEAQGKYDEARKSCDQAFNVYREINDQKGLANTFNLSGVIHRGLDEYEEAKESFNRSLEISRKVNDKRGESEAYKSIGTVCLYQGQANEALQWYLRGSKISEELGDNKLTSSFYTNIGTIYHQQGQHDKALTYYYKSLDLKEKLHDKYGQASIYNNIGLIYNGMKNFEQALFYHRKCLQMDMEIGSKVDIATDYNNIGNDHMSQGNYDSALYYFMTSLKMREELNRKRDIAHSLDNIGVLYAQKKEYDKSIEYLLRSAEINETLGDRKRTSLNYHNLGKTCILLGKYREAERYLKEGLTMREEMNDFFGTDFFLESLSILYDSLRDYENSLEYYKRFIVVRDSFSTETKHKEIVELQTKYETEKKEKEIAALQYENEIKTFWQKTYFVGLILTGFIGFGLVFLYRYRNKKNRQFLEIQQAQTEQLQEVDRMKSRFFANISHEFRTPLTLLLSPIESLLHEIKQDGVRSKLLMMRRNAWQLLKLINQMLDLSKLEAGKLELKASLGNIVPLLKGLLFSFNSLAEKNKIILQFNCREEEVFLFYESEKIEQVVTNLLSNALKFTPAHGKITLAIQRSQYGGKECLEIGVADTGIGISKDQLPFVFDRFFQADISDTKDYEGSGIGLSLAKELAHLHKGEITVESERGKGTTFRVFLPFGRGHLKDDEIVSFKVNIEPDRTMGSSDTRSNGDDFPEIVQDGDTDKPLILIVEDHPDLRSYLHSSLSDEFKVEHASDGKEGLEAAFKLIPSLIISDVMMPKMDGNELCKTLKSDIRTSHIPIILLTARSAEDDKIAGLEHKADDYLTKPFKSRELKVRVKNLIEIRNKLQEKFKSSVLVKPQEIEVSSLEQVFLEKLMAILEQNIGNESFGVEQLSDEMGMSRVHLHRKLQALTDHSPSHFIRSFRLQRAMDLLQKKAGTISEVAYSVGFSSPTYFSKCFAEEFGYPPKEVKGSLS